MRPFVEQVLFEKVLAKQKESHNVHTEYNSIFQFCMNKMIHQTIHNEAATAMVQVEPDLRYRPLCHDCGSPGR